MNKQLQTIYTVIVFVSVIVYLSNFSFKSHVNSRKNIKYFLIGISTIFILYSLYKTNDYINKYILPILLFLNVGILLFISLYDNELSNIHIVSMIGIVYLLLIFNYKEFEIKNGSLLQPNKQWIYQYILILGLWHLSSTEQGWIIPSSLLINNMISCLLLVYPLLFPIEEYFIHRCVSLASVYLLLNV